MRRPSSASDRLSRSAANILSAEAAVDGAS